MGARIQLACYDAPRIVNVLLRYFFGLKPNFCPPIEASYMRPPFAMVNMATPL